MFFIRSDSVARRRAHFWRVVSASDVRSPIEAESATHPNKLFGVEARLSMSQNPSAAGRAAWFLWSTDADGARHNSFGHLEYAVCCLGSGVSASLAASSYSSSS